MSRKIDAALTRAARAAAGLTREQFAVACGVSPQSVRLAEAQGPGPRVWPRIIAGAASLGVLIEPEAARVGVIARGD